MNAKSLILFTASFVLLSFVKGQNRKKDSVAVVAAFERLAGICDYGYNAKPGEDSIRYAHAAKYLVYRGDNKQRAWKVLMDYANPADKNVVEELLSKFKRSIVRDCNHHFVKYFTEKESEGIWHVLVVEYEKKSGARQVSYAFLKIGNRFGLGDID